MAAYRSGQDFRHPHFNPPSPSLMFGKRGPAPGDRLGCLESHYPPKYSQVMIFMDPILDWVKPKEARP